MKVLNISIEGMSCSHCQNAVSKAIESLAGVSKVEVSLENKTAVVSFDETVLTPTAIIASVEDEGYRVI